MFLTKPLVWIRGLLLLLTLLSLVMSMWDEVLPFGMDVSWEVSCWSSWHFWFKCVFIERIGTLSSGIPIDLTTYSTGDANSISVGAGTNIQDNALVHVAKTNLSGKVLPTVIGDNVTIGKFSIHFLSHNWSVNFIVRVMDKANWNLEQVIVLFYMAALSRMRPILVLVQLCWMELMLKNMPWLLRELLLGRTLEFPLARFLATLLCRPSQTYVIPLSSCEITILVFLTGLGRQPS